MPYVLIHRGRTEVFNIPPSSTGYELTHLAAAKFSLHPRRIRLQFAASKYVNPKMQLEKQIADNEQIIVKDIGPQVGYRFVFFMEYLGPIVIFALLHRFTLTQNYVVAWLFHFCKREFETFFVHKFSNETMPLRNLLKNCTYYWGFALLVALSKFNYENQAFLTAFYVCELLNGICHIQLRLLRRGSNSGYQNPKGILFRFIACPNYTFELLSWVCYALAFKNWQSAVFCCCGYLQIRVWAAKKKARLNKMFPETRRPFAVFPLPAF